MNDERRYVVYTIFRGEVDVESLDSARLHTERSRSKREAHDLAASYLMTLMAGKGGATVREVSQRPVAWQARFADAPSKDEIVVVLRHDQEAEFSFNDLWIETTATRSAS